jgi:hypothetical protein
MKNRTRFLTLLALLLSFAVPPAPTFAKDFMNKPRPLFFNDLVALDTEQHHRLALPAERKHFGFAKGAHLLPLTVAEVGLALKHYPLVFVAEGETFALVALTGLPGQGNRFIDAQGEWTPGVYIPAYVRGYPFIALRPSDKADPVLAFDPSAADFKIRGGQTLLGADGQPTEQLKGIAAFQAEYRQLAERTAVMTQALNVAGVLEEGTLSLKPQAGGEAQQIGGFLVVSEQKLKALSADALKKLMDADALGLAYAQLFSMGNLGNVLAAPSTLPEEKAAKPNVKAKRTRKAAE